MKRFREIPLRALEALIAPLMLLSAAPAHAGEIVERVVAVVNDEAILLSELRRRSAPFLDQVLQAPTEPQRRAAMRQLYDQLLDGLIHEALISQTARKMQIRVTPPEIEQAIHNVRQQSGLADREFWDAVRGQGFTEAQYRTDVRRQLLRLKVLNQRVRGRVNITEEDLRRRYREEVTRKSREVRFHASHLFFPLPEGGSASQKAAVRAQAQAVREELTAETFEAKLEELAGGDLGWLSEGDLPPALENALSALSPGEISQPVVGTSGLHILLLHERDQGAGKVPSFEDVREQYEQQMMQAAMQRQQKQFLEELQKQAVVQRRL